MTIPLLDEQQFLHQLLHTKNAFYPNYLACYSSWLGGIVKNPHLMVLPIDDHMVHRGDGVFEAVKAEGRAVYMLDAHLERLLLSAKKIALQPALTHEEMKTIILATLKAANVDSAMVRVFLSRGPGGFSVNPYDSLGPQFYVVITQWQPPADVKYQYGVALGKSSIPCKDFWLAQIKSCNYLQNVLMKKEAVDRGFEFAISVTADGHICEGYTENVMMIDHHSTLIYPPLAGILKGITMMRVCELAKAEGMKVIERPIKLDELATAAEVLMTGTTLDVMPICRFENTAIPLGPIAQRLRARMREDIHSGPYRSEF